jgi:hypothetical protein
MHTNFFYKNKYRECCTAYKLLNYDKLYAGHPLFYVLYNAVFSHYQNKYLLVSLSD